MQGTVLTVSRSSAEETVETVSVLGSRLYPRLKPGENEKHSTRELVSQAFAGRTAYGHLTLA
jgi:hypothetical protein